MTKRRSGIRTSRRMVSEAKAWAAMVPVRDRILHGMRVKGITAEELATLGEIPLRAVRRIMAGNPDVRIGYLQTAVYLTTGGMLDFELRPDLSTPKKAAVHAERELRRAK